MSEYHKARKVKSTENKLVHEMEHDKKKTGATQRTKVTGMLT